jgi:microcin C transport system substrate-binding protein
VGEDGIRTKWVTRKNGTQEKLRASVTFLSANEANRKWATIFKEDAYKKGVEINLQFMDWTSASKFVDEFKFDLFAIVWVSEPVPSPSQQFHGRSAMQVGTFNLSGLNDSRINQLIDEAPIAFDAEKRQKLFQELERAIVAAQPYIFVTVQKDHLVGYWKDKINPTERPYLPYSGTVERNPFWIRWSAE